MKLQAFSSSGMPPSLSDGNATSKNRRNRKKSAALQEAGEVVADLGMAQAVIHRRLQVAELGAAVVALAGKAHRQHPLVPEQLRDRVGELDLAARARRDLVEQTEDARREHVAAD